MNYYSFFLFHPDSFLFSQWYILYLSATDSMEKDIPVHCDPPLKDKSHIHQSNRQPQSVNELSGLP